MLLLKGDDDFWCCCVILETLAKTTERSLWIWRVSRVTPAYGWMDGAGLNNETHASGLIMIMESYLKIEYFGFIY